MFYVGVDLHKSFTQVYGFNDATGEVVERRVSNDKGSIRAVMSQFGENAKVVLEATRNWYWFVDLLQEMGIDVVLSNPLQTKAIAYAKVKTDKVDARMLSHLLRADLIPFAWIPSMEERGIREMLRTRLTLVRIRARFKNLVRSILAKLNIVLSHGDIWRGKGRKELEQLNLPSPYNEILPHYLSIIDNLDKYIEEWNRKIERIAKETPEVFLLKSVPGIGTISALTILYETGPIDRFPSAKRYSSYAGLVPRVKGSGGKFKTGHLSRQANMYLKWIYVEIATGIVRIGKGYLYEYYKKQMYKKGKNVAKIALARKISRMVYHLLKQHITYDTFVERNVNKMRRTG